MNSSPHLSIRRYVTFKRQMQFGSLGIALMALVAMPLLAGPRLQFSSLASSGSHGEVRVRGTATITVTDLNWFRYRYEIRRQATTISAPPVKNILPFLPDAIAAPAQSGEQIGAMRKGKSGSIETLVSKAAEDATSAQQATQQLVRELRAFVRASGEFSGEALKGRVADLLAKIKPTSDRQWPDTYELKTNLRLSLAPSVNAGPEKTAQLLLLERTLDQIDARKPDWREAEDQIAKFQEHLRGAQGLESKMSESTVCGLGPRKEQLTLVVFDLFPPSATDEDAAAVAEVNELPLVTFICEHPLSFSTGVFASSLDEREFDYRPTIKRGDEAGGPTATDAIGFASRSGFQIMPGVMVNTRLVRLTDGLALHLSFGALADFAGVEGTDLEFILGPSLGIKRSALLTVGVHVGRVSELQGGFEVGAPKIEGLDAVPTQTSYKAGLGFGISYAFGPN